MVISYQKASAIYNRLTVCDTIEAAYNQATKALKIQLSESELKSKIIQQKTANEDDLKRINLVAEDQLKQYRQANAALEADNRKYKNRSKNNFWYGLLTGGLAISGIFVLAK